MRPSPSVFVPAASHIPVHLPVRQPSLEVDDCDPRGCKWRPLGSASGGFDAHDMTVLIILLCALICVVALHSAIRCFLRGGSSDPLQSNPGPYESTAPAQKLAEDRALTVAYSEGLGLAAADCAICLTEFEEGVWVRVLERCRHSFHVECIQRWLSSHTSCPNCRSSCFPPPGS